MPTVLDALLICNKCRLPRLHVFHERREPEKRRRGAGPIFDDLIYVCEVCETERIWGNESKLAEGWASRRQLREEHAIAAHGLREIECPACRGLGFGCSQCGGKGEVWEWDEPEPCGADCPLRTPEGR